MVEPTVEVYAASCNPSRRAKRPLPVTSVSAALPDGAKPVPIQPRRAAGKQDILSEDTLDLTSPAPAPAKRGRKPGPLSRAAREAQRRLNHSIIEKARRTKINDALATLRELVPLEYGQNKSPALQPIESDADDDVEDYQSSSSKQKKAGKKPEKEKEFKLEILIRTVAYMKDLISRVAELEAQVVAGGQPQVASGPPSEVSPSRKRQRSNIEDVEPLPQSNRPRTDHYSRTQGPLSPTNVATFSSRPPPVFRPNLEGPLPSISSWLPDTVVDPRLRPSGSKQTQQSPPGTSSYLPSPPSSTHFEPTRSSHLPPTLSLAALSSSASSSSSSSGPNRTPEDENVATLLIQMSTSPSFRHVYPSSSTASGVTSPPKLRMDGDLTTRAPDSPERPSSPGHRSSSSLDSHPPYNGSQAQTPATLLGLTHLWKP